MCLSLLNWRYVRASILSYLDDVEHNNDVHGASSGNMDAWEAGADTRPLFGST